MFNLGFSPLELQKQIELATQNARDAAAKNDPYAAQRAEAAARGQRWVGDAYTPEMAAQSLQAPQDQMAAMGQGISPDQQSALQQQIAFLQSRAGGMAPAQQQQGGGYTPPQQGGYTPPAQATGARFRTPDSPTLMQPANAVVDTAAIQRQIAQSQAARQAQLAAMQQAAAQRSRLRRPAGLLGRT